MDRGAWWATGEKKNKDAATTPVLSIIYSTGRVASGFFFFL